MAESRIISVPFEAKFQVTADGQVTPLPSAPRGTESFGGGLSAEDRDLLEKAQRQRRSRRSSMRRSIPIIRPARDTIRAFLGGGGKIVGFPKLSDALEAEAHR